MQKIKCPWCSKLVKVSKKGRLLSHVQCGKIKCVGIGQDINTVKFLNKRNEPCEK